MYQNRKNWDEKSPRFLITADDCEESLWHLQGQRLLENLCFSNVHIQGCNLTCTNIHMCSGMRGQDSGRFVVRHSDAIKGEPTQSSSCQSSDERQAGLRFFTAPGEMNIILETSTASSFKITPKPQSWSLKLSLNQQTERGKTCVHKYAEFGNAEPRPHLKE